MMRPLGTDPAAWVKRWSIEPFTHPCSGCGKPQTTSVPFAQGELRGLVAPDCECGALPPYCAVRDSRKGDLLDEP